MYMLRKLRSNFIRWKHQRYMQMLCNRGMKLGNGVSIEDGFFFDPSHCYLIEIGDNCTFAPNVRIIAHDASTRRITGFTRLARVIIENDCFIGDSVLILPGVTVGEGSIVGAGSVVTRSIPKGSVVVGNPARVLCTVEDFKARQLCNVAEGPKFSSDYWIGNASQRHLEELLAASERGPVFMV
jgi:maltose O-acetyltransferase